MKLTKKSLISIPNEVPVYDIEVNNEYHNFQLAAGNYVHNCTNATSSEFWKLSRLDCHNLKECSARLQSMISDWKANNKGEVGYYSIYFREGILVEESIVSYKDILKLTELPDNAFDEFPSTIAIFNPDEKLFKSDLAEVPLASKFIKAIMKGRNKDVHFYVNGIEDTSVLPDYGYNITVRCNNPTEGTINPFIDFIVSFGVSENFRDSEYIMSVNGLDTQNGKHVRMIRDAYSNAFKSIFGSCQDYEYYGINFCGIIQCYEPVFSSQTKETLYDVPEFNYRSLPALEKAFRKVILANKDIFEQNYQRIIQYLDSMNALGKLGKIKAKVAIASECGSKSQIYTPIKLKDCTTRDRNKAELFICEGLSALGPMLLTRDKSIHACLPLRGKCKNTVGMDIVDVLDNAEMYDIINSIGVGVNDHHDLSEVRYGKIIIAADADADGANINALVLAALMTHLTFLIEAGYVYIAEMPLFNQNGVMLFKSDGSYKQLDKTKPFTRYKGLGEMDPDELANCLFNPKTRRLLKVTLQKDQLQHASSTMTSSLARRQLMIDNEIFSEFPFVLDTVDECKSMDTDELNSF